MHLIAGIVLLGVGSVFFALAASGFIKERPYRSSLEGDAVVVRKLLLPATPRASTSYELTYKVRRSDTEEWQKTESVDATTWDGVEEGSTVRVQYLPGDSQSVRIERQVWDVPWGIAAALCIPVALFGLGLIFRGVRDVWQTGRIYRQGQPAEATVTAVHETNVAINRRIQWAVDFTFRDHLGATQQGTSVPMSPSAALEWQEGDKGMVRYDPDRPQHSVWVGK